MLPVVHYYLLLVACDLANSHLLLLYNNMVFVYDVDDDMNAVIELFVHVLFALAVVVVFAVAVVVAAAAVVVAVVVFAVVAAVVLWLMMLKQQLLMMILA